MRALITGAGGFVGHHLAPHLASEGWEIRGYDLDLDVVDRDAVRAAFLRDRPDAVVHLAAQSSVRVSRDRPTLTHRVNYLGTLSVLHAALACPTRPRVLLIGSADQYGTTSPGSRPFDEDSPLRPRSAYGRSKAEADQLGAAFAGSGLEVVRVRAFNHTGPGQPPVFAIPSFARQIAEVELGRREPVMRVGNRSSVRDVIDVRDVVDAYARLLDRAVPPGAYNVAGGVGHTIGDLLARLLAFAREKPEVVEAADLWRPTDYSVGDARKLREATGWSPKIPIETTLADVLDYWRAELSAP